MIYKLCGQHMKCYASENKHTPTGLFLLNDLGSNSRHIGSNLTDQPLQNTKMEDNYAC
jgi:hypothetical protein